MYRLVIVDDQPAEIDGIRRLLDWEALGVEIAGTATDGREGYNVCLDLEPDLLISDVVMPLADGIRMVRELQDSLSGFRPIFISSFDDYKFLSEAIESGAHRYVLKPILPGELEKAVRSAVQALEQEREQLAENKRLRGLIERHSADLRKRILRGYLLSEPEQELGEMKTLVDLPAPPFQVVALEVDGTGNGDLALSLPVFHRLEAAMAGAGVLVEVSVKRSALVLCGDGASEAVDSLLPKIRELEQKLDVAVRAGLGDLVESLTALGTSYATAVDALSSAQESDSGLARYSDVRFDEPQELPHFAVVLDRLRACIFGNPDVETSEDVSRAPDRVVSELLNSAGTRDSLLLHAAAVVHGMHVIRERTGMKGGLTVSEILSRVGQEGADGTGLRRELVAAVEQLQLDVAAADNESSHRFVRAMDRYIQEHYTEPIQVQDVAYSVELSPGYANLIYRSATGRTLHNVITGLRMTRAQQLLSEDNRMIQEVAELSGFTSSGYFISVFRRHFGCTPGEFRRK